MIMKQNLKETNIKLRIKKRFVYNSFLIYENVKRNKTHMIYSEKQQSYIFKIYFQEIYYFCCNETLFIVFEFVAMKKSVSFRKYEYI